MSTSVLIDHVLVSAYACHPREGSEPGVGWQSVLAALEVATRVTVLTRRNNVPAVKSELSDLGLNARTAVVGFDLAEHLQRIKKSIPCGTQIYYLAWQLAARRVVQEIHRNTPIDIAHHATFAADWLPTALRKSGLRYVWGPVGGSSVTPLPLWRWLGVRGTGAELARRTVVRSGRVLFGRREARTAELALAQNQDTVDWVGKVARSVQLLPNVAVPEYVSELRSCRLDGRYIAVGRLIPWKGWALAIDALATTSAGELTFVGIGPDLARLRRRSKRRGVEHRVHFIGSVSRDEVIRRMQCAEVVLQPSFQEAAGWAVAEALAAGCRVVALDLAGPSGILRRAGIEPIAWRGRKLPRRLGQALASTHCCHADRHSWSEARFRAQLGEALSRSRRPAMTQTRTD